MVAGGGLVVIQNPVVGHQTDRCHVRGTDGLDLVYRLKSLLIEEIVKIGNYLVQKSQTLDPLVVTVEFRIELMVIGNGGENNTDP